MNFNNHKPFMLLLLGSTSVSVHTTAAHCFMTTECWDVARMHHALHFQPHWQHSCNEMLHVTQWGCYLLFSLCLYDHKLMNGNRLFFKKTGVNRNRLLKKKKETETHQRHSWTKTKWPYGKKGLYGWNGFGGFNIFRVWFRHKILIETLIQR